MSNDYAVVSALIFALVALVHVVRLIKGWAVQIGPHSISMSVSWVGLVVATLIAIWGFMQLGLGRHARAAHVQVRRWEFVVYNAVSGAWGQT
jgi:hypothetical protein